jgi:hypothetical protein
MTSPSRITHPIALAISVLVAGGAFVACGGGSNGPEV